MSRSCSHLFRQAAVDVMCDQENLYPWEKSEDFQKPAVGCEESSLSL